MSVRVLVAAELPVHRDPGARAGHHGRRGVRAAVAASVAHVRAAVYLRQSLDRDGSGLAVARQREDCLKLCADRGWDHVEYVDNDISASTAKARPAYIRMLADIAAGRLDGVVAWDLDRPHRRPVELEHFIDLPDRHRLP